MALTPQQQRRLTAQVLLTLAQQGSAHKQIADYQVNHSGGKRDGQRYSTLLTDGGNVIHRYLTGEDVFVRKQPAQAAPKPVGSAFDMGGAVGSSLVAPGSEADQAGSLAVPLAQLLAAKKRRKRPQIITEIAG